MSAVRPIRRRSLPLGDGPQGQGGNMSAVPTVDAGRFGSGQQVQRVEDPALLAGKGQFTDDVAPAGQLHMVFVRSPHAHARIVSIDSAAAAAMPGVTAVFTGAQLVQAGVKPLPTEVPFKRSDGKDVVTAPRRALAHERVRYRGEAVAMVVAASHDAARAAADAVMVEYDELPAVTDVVAAMRPGAPKVRRRAAGQRGRRDALRRRGGRAGGVSACRGAGGGRHPQPAPGAHADGAARGAGRVRCQDAAPADSPVEPDAHRRARRRVRRLESEGRRGARGGGRRRRRLRHEDRLLSGRRGGGACRAHVGPAGEVARRAAGGVSLRGARARRDLPCRDGARCARQGARAAREGGGQHRRLCHRRRPVHSAGGGPVGHDQHLRHPDHRSAVECGDDAHRQPGALPRRGPARGDLHHRAAVRRRGARDETRPGRAAPAQHDPARSDAVQEPDGAGVRQRPVREDPEPGPRAGRLERLRRRAARPQRAAASCAAAALPRFSSGPAARCSRSVSPSPSRPTA